MVGPTLFLVWITIMLARSCKNNMKLCTRSCEIHLKAQHSGKVSIFFSPGATMHIFKKGHVI